MLSLNGIDVSLKRKTHLVLNGGPVVDYNGRLAILNGREVYNTVINGAEIPPPDNGCVLYLPGLPAQGATINDYSGNGNHGTISGATWTRLPSGLWVLSYDGTDDFINIDGVLTSISSATAGTFEMWIKVANATPAASMNFIVFGDTNVDEYIQFNVVATTGLLSAACNDAGIMQWTLKTDAQAFLDNTWAHIALTQDATSPILYINGVAVAQAFSVSTNKTRWFSVCTGIDNGRVGCINYNSFGDVGELTGLTGLVSVYSTALSAATLLSHYNQERHLFNV